MNNYNKPVSLHLDANMHPDEVDARIDAFLRETFGDEIVDQSEEIDETCPVCGESHGYALTDKITDDLYGDDGQTHRTDEVARASLNAYTTSRYNQDETLEKMAKLLAVCVAKLGGSVVVTQDEIECLDDTNLTASGDSEDFNDGDITLTLVNA